MKADKYVNVIMLFLYCFENSLSKKYVGEKKLDPFFRTKYHRIMVNQVNLKMTAKVKGNKWSKKCEM